MKIPKIRNKAFKIDLHIYPCDIYVGFKNLKMFEKLLESEKFDRENIDLVINSIKDNIETCAAACYIFTDNGYGFIFINSDTIDLADGITHEVYHITESICEFIGLKHSKKSEEAFCYLNGYINKKIFEQL